jgi:hypothetical protein
MCALADHRLGETDQAKKACRKAAEMLMLAGADSTLRPLLRQTVSDDELALLSVLRALLERTQLDREPK